VPVHTAAYIYRGPLALRIWEDRDPQTQDLIAIRPIYQYLRTESHHLYGRPPASAGVRGAHLDGLFHGKWEGNIPDCLYDPQSSRAGIGANGIPSSDRITLVEHFIRHGQIT